MPYIISNIVSITLWHCTLYRELRLGGLSSDDIKRDGGLIHSRCDELMLILLCHSVLIMLQDLEQSGEFDPSSEFDKYLCITTPYSTHIPSLYVYYHPKQCLAIVFLPILERELQEFVQYWNSHPLRRNRLTECPQGIPDDLYDMPNQYGREDHLKTINSSVWMNAMINDAQPPEDMYSNDLYHDCQELVRAHFGIDLHRQVTASNAVRIYKYIVNNV